MSNELPYLASYKNVPRLFERIREAKQPDTFTHKFLYDTIGLKAVSDRPLIAFLRALGFLDGSNKPTPEYGNLRNEALAPRAISAAIRSGYAPLFAANENAHKLNAEQLRGLVNQVSGADKGTVTKITGTLNSLLRLASLDAATPPGSTKSDPKREEPVPDKLPEGVKSLRADFHYNIQIHLPGGGSEETYLNIFNALRKTFQ